MEFSWEQKGFVPDKAEAKVAQPRKGNTLQAEQVCQWHAIPTLQRLGQEDHGLHMEVLGIKQRQVVKLHMGNMSRRQDGILIIVRCTSFKDMNSEVPGG